MQVDRRQFVGTLTKGTLAGASFAGHLLKSELKAQTGQSNVALKKGSDRKRNLVEALEMIAPEIQQGIRGRTLLIKPNLTRVLKEDQLASSHVDSIWALCHVFSSFYSGKIVIAEGTGPGRPLKEALDNYDYAALSKQFNVEFLDLREDTYTTTYMTDLDHRPVELRVSKTLLDPGYYIVSSAVMKTHSLSVVTLGLKNFVMAVPMNFGNRQNDRSKMHKERVDENPRPFNFNLFQLARLRVPDLVAIDGFVGMQGEGPLSGDPIESGVALAGTDWLAADRVGIDVMGFDFSKIAHYRYCASAGMGNAELDRIKVLGDKIGNCRMPYQPPASYEKILA